MRHSGSASTLIAAVDDALDAGTLDAEARGVDAPGGIDDVLINGRVTSDFQPIFDLDSGAVVAYEGLARGPAGPLHRPDALFAAARAANRLCDLGVLCRRSALGGA